jgi:thioredoxin 1
MEPVYIELARDLMPQVLFGTVDVDSLPDVAARYKVYAMPSFALFHDGKLLDILLGMVLKKELREFIEHTLLDKVGLRLH